jgi:predicted enzyme related to lactoylglutathione lyase
MNPVVYFEMPYDDKVRMTKLYGHAFDWQSQMLGVDMGDYVVTTTTPT